MKPSRMLLLLGDKAARRLVADAERERDEAKGEAAKYKFYWEELARSCMEPDPAFDDLRSRAEAAERAAAETKAEVERLKKDLAEALSQEGYGRMWREARAAQDALASERSAHAETKKDRERLVALCDQLKRDVLAVNRRVVEERSAHEETRQAFRVANANLTSFMSQLDAEKAAHAKTREALEAIAKVKYGLDGTETDEYLAEHWARRALEYESIARAALRASASPVETCNAPGPKLAPHLRCVLPSGHLDSLHESDNRALWTEPAPASPPEGTPPAELNARSLVTRQGSVVRVTGLPRVFTETTTVPLQPEGSALTTRAHEQGCEALKYADPYAPIPMEHCGCGLASEQRPEPRRFTIEEVEKTIGAANGAYFASRDPLSSMPSEEWVAWFRRALLGGSPATEGGSR